MGRDGDGSGLSMCLLQVHWVTPCLRQSICRLGIEPSTNRKDSSRQQNGIAFRYHDCVFIVSGKAPICSAYRPSVREQSFAAISCRNDGFDCENQAVKKLRTTRPIVEVG